MRQKSPAVLPTLINSTRGAFAAVKLSVILNTGGFMDTQKIVAEIDAEIFRLQQVKALLTGTKTAENRKSRRNSMAGSSRKKRNLSAEARERIAAAQRARWAESKKALKRRAARNSSAVSVRKKARGAIPALKTAKKRTVSLEARARMAAGQKARWAKVEDARQKAARSVGNSPAKRAAIPTKSARKAALAKRARTPERANAPTTKGPVAPPAPAALVTIAS